MKCNLQHTGTDGARFIHRCYSCGRVVRHPNEDPATIKATCGAAVTIEPRLSAKESKALFGESDQTLIGDKLAALFEAVGIPECGGCKKRKEWLNRAHAWVKAAVSDPGS